MDPLHDLGADDAQGFDPARLRRRIADLGGPPAPEADRPAAPAVEFVSGDVADLASPSRPGRLSARMGLGAFVAAAAVVIGVVAFAPRPPEPVPTIADLREMVSERPVPAGPVRTTVLETYTGQVTATRVEIRPDADGGGTITYSPGTAPPGLGGTQSDEPPYVWPVEPSAPLVAGFTVTELQALPADADALRRTVDARIGPAAAPAETPKALLDLATATFLPEGTRRAALQSLESLEASPAGPLRDPLGREGVALRSGGAAGWLLVLDRDTGWPLAFAPSVRGSDLASDDVSSWTLWTY